MHDPKPSISIIVPVYNAHKYLKEALDSLIHQKTPATEIIVIDDGSTDGSTEILRKYSTKKNMQILETSNNGCGSARNLGRAIAKSEYVYFFDSDDLLDVHFITRMHEMIIEFDRPDLIMFSAETFHDDGFTPSFSPNYRRTISGVFEPGKSFLSEMVKRREDIVNPFIYLSRNEVWSHNRLVFPPYKHEDEAVFFPLLALSRKTVILNEVYYRRRLREGSIMTSKFDADNVNGLLRAIHEMREFMVQNPALVKPNIRAWRIKLVRQGLNYLALARGIGVGVSWTTIISCLITGKSIGGVAKVMLILLPKPIKRLIKTLIKRI